MQPMRLKAAFGEAEKVRFSDDGRLAVVWCGGTTFNVYRTGPNGEGPVREVDVFSLSDRKGRPVGPDRAEQKMAEILDRQTAAP